MTRRNLVLVIVLFLIVVGGLLSDPASRPELALAAATFVVGTLTIMFVAMSNTRAELVHAAMGLVAAVLGLVWANYVLAVVGVAWALWHGHRARRIWRTV